jgi:hypothetical protein
VDPSADRVFVVPADALQDDEGMEAAELEAFIPGFRGQIGLRHPTSTMTPANATVPHAPVLLALTLLATGCGPLLLARPACELSPALVTATPSGSWHDIEC